MLVGKKLTQFLFKLLNRLEPFMSGVETSGKYSASKLQIVSTTPAGVVISASRFDEINNKLFFMYRELNPNKKPIVNNHLNSSKLYIVNFFKK